MAVGQPTNNDKSPPTKLTQDKKGRKIMTHQETKHHEVNQEITKFEKTMQELHLLRNVSKDLKNFRKMMKLKKYD